MKTKTKPATITESMKFDGDIIITDPCYVINKKTSGRIDYDDKEAWAALGVKNCMARDTIYGDWGCTVFDTDDGQVIGEFCADSGMVAVFLLDEILKYNPEFDYHINRKWTTTLIKDFNGLVQFVVEEEKYEYNGKECTDYSVHVVGHGVDKNTGEPKNFRSTQTGL